MRDIRRDLLYRLSEKYLRLVRKCLPAPSCQIYQRVDDWAATGLQRIYKHWELPGCMVAWLVHARSATNISVKYNI